VLRKGFLFTYTIGIQRQSTDEVKVRLKYVFRRTALQQKTNHYTHRYAFNGYMHRALVSTYLFQDKYIYHIIYFPINFYIYICGVCVELGDRHRKTCWRWRAFSARV